MHHADQQAKEHMQMPVWCRSPEEHEAYDDDDDAEEDNDSPSVSRRLDSSFANSGARPSQSGQTLDSYSSLCVCVCVCVCVHANSGARPSQSGQTLELQPSVPCVAHPCMANLCP